MGPLKLFVATLILAGSSAGAAKVPATWDGLVHVKSKKVAAVYLLPHADFRAYSRVMFDAPQVAFQKNWVRDYNSSTSDFLNRVSDNDVKKWVDEGQSYLGKVFPAQFTKAGFQVADAPGPDVLKLTVLVLDMTVAAPDTGGMGQTFSVNAGQATLAIEARDSLTGQLLGRFVDPKVAGDGPGYRRSYGSNHADFEELFDNWAKVSASGLAVLRSSSPINTDGLRKN